MKRRPPISRRTFLKLTATVAAGAALASCTPNQSTSLPINTATTGATSAVPPNPTIGVATGTTPTEATPAETNPTEAVANPEPSPTNSSAYLAVVHGSDPAIITRAAIDTLGGMASFVSSGFDVIIKPNICTDYHPPEYATTTNPIVVGTLVSMCLEAGAKRVRVMDYPFGGTPQSAYAISGIADAVEAAGGEMHIMSRPKYTRVDIPLGKNLTRVEIYPDILEADLLINVPIAKHHGSTRLTLGEKNLMGVILDRNLMHINLSQRIADLTSLVLPALTVVDAVRILTNHGPTGGDLEDVKQLDTVIASRDIVAADSYATTLFGLTATDIGYIQASAELGLGSMDLNSINIQEINLG
ncbi:MAG: DUF362 domain-containing protein [Anaerolineales bacterium]